MPALVVFQTLPDAAATYQVLLSLGWMAMQEMRPEATAGPMERKRKPPKVAVEISPGFLGLAWAAGAVSSARLGTSRNRLVKDATAKSRRE